MSKDRGSARRVPLASRTPEQVVEAELSWICSLVLFFCTVYNLLKLDMLWVAFGVAAISLYILPVVSMRDPFKALPWEMALLLSAPVLLHITVSSHAFSENLAFWDDLSSLAFAFSLSTLGFLLTIELHMYTEVRMNRAFAVMFVIVFTLAVSGFWQVGEYFGDQIYGTHYQGTNDDVMKGFLWTLVGGILMGTVYDLYLRAMPDRRRKSFGLAHLWEVSRRSRD